MKLSNKYALTNVTIIDGKGNDPISGQVVVVSEDRIEYIGDCKDYKPGDDIEIVDMSGRTIIPGLIDCHIHLFGASENLDKELMTSDITMQALRSVAQARKVIKHGFTSLRDVTYNGLYLKRLFAEGDIVGPRIISSGPGLNHPAMYATAANWETLEPIKYKNNWGMACYTTADIEKSIRILLSEGADQIKVFVNGSGVGATDRVLDQHFDLDEIKLVVKEAKKVKDTKVIAHLFDNKSAWDCLVAGVDTFEHLGFLDEELCEEMVKQNKYLVPTATLLTLWGEEEMESFPLKEGFYHRDLYEGYIDEDVANKCAEDFKLAYKKGVKIALGTDTIIDAMTPYGEFSALELKQMNELGMTPLEVINSATQIGSEVLGLEDQIGTVEEGKIADLLVLKENPAEDIDVLVDSDNIEYVIQSGKIVVEDGNLIG